MRIAEDQKPAPGELYLDHVAHFVPDLGAAALLAESVGFVVTPESAHRAQGAPAGTSNRCIMLEEGYIEILAPTLDTPNARRVRDHMARYNGVHLASFGTPDAEAEHRRLAGHGFQPEPLISLERKLDDGHKVRFKVIHVPPAQMPEGRVQYAQQLTPEQIWRDEHLRHTNGVVGLAAVYVAAADPPETAARWARFTGLLPRRDGDFVYLQTARGSVFVGPGEAPAIVGYALRCRDPKSFLSRCERAGLCVRDNTVALPTALGSTWLVV